VTGVLRTKMMRACRKNAKIPEAHAEWAISEVFKQMILGIARDGEVKIEGFGRFFVVRSKRHKKMSRLPGHFPGKIIQFGGRNRVRFTPGVRTKAAINGREWIDYGDKAFKVREREDHDRQHQIRQQEGGGEISGSQNTPKKMARFALLRCNLSTSL